MKIRAGFVSNSSSSSFVINVCKITGDQMNKFLDWIDSDKNEDGWSCRYEQENGFLTGYTMMDNGCIESIIDELGITAIHFGE